ncbi:4-(cytidine 5'-diphospho)-2-C-methyl-D-erythritol kinase [Salibacteraceae bacterium]|nr:4-(cytidine 5'-diphospho)-2-C-methyl-D-erythritol kinase [Salibacteraceae bacterium]
MISFSNAKINLGLFVGQKRSDGFHEIKSLFLPIPLYDVLEAIPADEIALSTYGRPIPPGENLVSKANKILMEREGAQAFHWHLLKNIPIGAGLGGGSSNAAKALQLLNPKSNIRDLAEELGSDCPFFLDNRLCLVEGRGEVLTPISTEGKTYHLLLVNPGIHISTSEAYSGISKRESFPDILSIFGKGLNFWRENLHNDFEETVFKLQPSIRNLKLQMYACGARYASMSGSGSSVYGIFDEVPAFLEVPSAYFQRRMQITI